VFDRMNLFTQDPKRDELKAIPLFAELPRREFELVARNSDLVEIPAGTTVIREGDRGREFFAIVEGDVEISQGGTPVATEHAGDVFGEIALLHDVPRTATVKAKTPLRLYVLTAPAFRGLLAGSFA
jgi:CRP-like cAMP-binding protein